MSKNHISQTNDSDFAEMIPLNSLPRHGGINPTKPFASFRFGRNPKNGRRLMGVENDDSEIFETKNTTSLPISNTNPEEESPLKGKKGQNLSLDDLKTKMESKYCVEAKEAQIPSFFIPKLPESVGMSEIEKMIQHRNSRWDSMPKVCSCLYTENEYHE